MRGTHVRTYMCTPSQIYVSLMTVDFSNSLGEVRKIGLSVEHSSTTCFFSLAAMIRQKQSNPPSRTPLPPPLHPSVWAEYNTVDSKPANPVYSVFFLGAGTKGRDDVVIFMPEGDRFRMGGTMRLGARTTVVSDHVNSAAYKLYGGKEGKGPLRIDERHRHR